mmetsp:Transcript_7463/g.20700  ORF Transcript_7463/g.20700 Transcript_7463/m.20700 type:complete len:420 (+) Transcript_7463:14-1273(+)
MKVRDGPIQTNTLLILLMSFCFHNCRSSKFKMYGVIFLTIVYAAFTLAVQVLVEEECLNDPCNSEGLDSSILGWATDFFIAGAMMTLGLFLLCNKETTRSAAWTLILMGLAYVLGGLGHSIWTNSGYDDNLGQQEYYICWAGSFTLMTLSVWQTVRYLSSTLQSLNDQHRIMMDQAPIRRLKRFLRVTFAINFLFWAALLGGYLWCATKTDLHTDSAVDDVPELDQPEKDRDECLNLAIFGEVGWYISFALFWIPAARLLRNMQRAAQPTRIYGMPLAWATWWIMIVPWTFGIMLIVWVGVTSLIIDGEMAVDLYSDIYAAVIYHYGMLLQYFLFHNVALGLHQAMSAVHGDPNADKEDDIDTEKARNNDAIIDHEPPSVHETTTTPSNEEEDDAVGDETLVAPKHEENGGASSSAQVF